MNEPDLAIPGIPVIVPDYVARLDKPLRAMVARNSQTVTVKTHDLAVVLLETRALRAVAEQYDALVHRLIAVPAQTPAEQPEDPA